MWKPSPRRRGLEGKPRRESPKRTISTNGGSGSLQMVSEPDTGRWAPKGSKCASKDVGPQKGVDLGQSHIDWRKERVPARTLCPKGRSIRGRKECQEC